MQRLYNASSYSLQTPATVISCSSAKYEDDREGPKAKSGVLPSSPSLLWRWIFYINLPVGVLCTLGIVVFIRQTLPVNPARRNASAIASPLASTESLGPARVSADRRRLSDPTGATSARAMVGRASGA